MADASGRSTITLERPPTGTLPGFFTERPADGIGLAMFLNAGDPPLGVLRDVVQMLDRIGVDCLELAVPFPNSVTDGPVIRRSAERALGHHVGLDDVLAFVSDVHPTLKHLRIALLADWSHSVRPTPLPDFVSRVKDSGAHALLLHGLPPRLRESYYAAAHQAAQPIVTTCYASSGFDVLDEAGRQVSAYLYLVAQYGRTGAAPSGGYEALAGVVGTLRGITKAPIAIGFGVSNRSHIQALRNTGADAAIVGSAGVSRVERALAEARDVVEELHTFVSELRITEPVCHHWHRERTSPCSFYVCRKGSRR